MATLDLPYMRLYRNKTKETNSLRTDDIIGAKPRRAVRDRDPEAFDKMNQLKKLQQNVNVEGADPMRKTSKNLDHYHRMVSNLPGGVARWEGMYNNQRGGGSGMKDVLTHYENNEDKAPAATRDANNVKAPFYRDEKAPLESSYNVKRREIPSTRLEASLDAKRFAAESSLNGLGGADKRPFGQPSNPDFGVKPEQLPTLVRPTRFRSPQPMNGKEHHDMSKLMAHQ